MDSWRKQNKDSICWSELRAAAIAIGVREAGRQASAHLPKDEQERFVQRVMKRSQREGWIKQAQSLTVQTTQAKPLSASVRNGSTAIVSHLESSKRKIKTHLTRYLVNASKVASRSRSPLSDSQDVKNVASVLVSVFPDKDQDGSGTLSGLRVYSKQTVLNVQVKD